MIGLESPATPPYELRCAKPFRRPRTHGTKRRPPGLPPPTPRRHLARWRSAQPAKGRPPGSAERSGQRRSITPCPTAGCKCRNHRHCQRNHAGGCPEIPVVNQPTSAKGRSTPAASRAGPPTGTHGDADQVIAPFGVRETRKSAEHGPCHAGLPPRTCDNEALP